MASAPPLSFAFDPPELSGPCFSAFDHRPSNGMTSRSSPGIGSAVIEDDTVAAALASLSASPPSPPPNVHDERKVDGLAPGFAACLGETEAEVLARRRPNRFLPPPPPPSTSFSLPIIEGAVDVSAPAWSLHHPQPFLPPAAFQQQQQPDPVNVEAFQTEYGYLSAADVPPFPWSPPQGVVDPSVTTVNTTTAGSVDHHYDDFFAPRQQPLLPTNLFPVLPEHSVPTAAAGLQQDRPFANLMAPVPVRTVSSGVVSGESFDVETWDEPGWAMMGGSGGEESIAVVDGEGEVEMEEGEDGRTIGLGVGLGLGGPTLPPPASHQQQPTSAGRGAGWKWASGTGRERMGTFSIWPPGQRPPVIRAPRPQKPVSDPELRRFKCEMCGKAFKRSGTYNQHKRTHTGERPHICPFRECAKAFQTTSNLKRHIRTHKEPPPPPSFGGFNRLPGPLPHRPMAATVTTGAMGMATANGRGLVMGGQSQAPFAFSTSGRAPAVYAGGGGGRQ